VRCNRANRDAAIVAEVSKSRRSLMSACTAILYEELGFVGDTGHVTDSLSESSVSAAEQLLRDTYVADYGSKP
jgi:hypothetical protein